MRPSLLSSSLLWGLSVCSAGASDVSIRSSLTQTLEANSNYQMLPRSPGFTFLPITSLMIDAIVRTPTTRLQATANLSYRAYLGPGADDLVPGLDKGFRAIFEKYANLTNFRIEGGTRMTAASTLQLEETGIATRSGDVTTTWVEGGVRRQMGYNDLLALSARATSSEFTNAPGSQSISATAIWTRRLTSLTEITPMVQYDTISRDDGANNETSIWRATLGISSRLTKRLTVSGAAGATMVNVGASAGVTNTDPTALPVLASGGTAIDWIGNLQASYRLTHRDTVSLFASKAIGPDSFAVIREFQVIGAAFSHQFNRSTSATITADYSHQPGQSGAIDLYSTSARLNHQFTREWFGAVSYRYRHRATVTSEADSHALYLSIRRDFTILPSAGGAPEPPTRTDIGTVLGWPSAWIRPWRDATWWQRP